MTVDAAFVLVDKQSEWTSHDVVGKARRIFQMKKIGHAGTLDPMATGLVVLGLGRATRLLRFVQDQPKEYVATAQFGVATDSLDADGAVLDRTPMAISEQDVHVVLDRFIGDIMQIPPMVSAVRIDGQRLYALAREGKEVERPPRPVTVHSIDVEDVAPGPYPEVELRVVCGSGTYIRTLADDIAGALGGRASLTALRRLRNGPLEVRTAWTIDELVELADEDRLDEALLDPSDALSMMPARTTTGIEANEASNGRKLAVGDVGAGQDAHVRVLDGGRLIGVYRVDGKELVPEVVLG